MSSLLEPVPLMVLGTSSGAGKSLMAAALCRVLLRRGETPLPFKGQNMSNNAWVDEGGGEMAYSQALQAWASGMEPNCIMNPVLLKPKGDCTSEVIHLGKSVGIAIAETYYEEWFEPGWEAIVQGLNKLRSLYKEKGRLVLEGAGSPVEVNLKSRDLTNLRLAKFLNANCLLVADIERGGVFAQIIGTLSLMQEDERRLVKGLLINRFRGSLKLFDEGRSWLEAETGIPVVGVMPWLKETFPPEDSLDLLERKNIKANAEIEIVVIKLPSLSNFSDLDPLEAEHSVQLRWVQAGDCLGRPDCILLPGSKQTLKDLGKLHSSGLGQQIKDFALKGGNVFGICGGMQMLGRTLEDPFAMEHFKQPSLATTIAGLNLIPIHTMFGRKKFLSTRQLMSCWPARSLLSGFEMHYGKSYKLEDFNGEWLPLMEDQSLGWISEVKGGGNVGGTYLHGIFENGIWRRLWLNELRKKKGLPELSLEAPHHSQKREKLLDLLADSLEKYVDISPLLS